MMDRDFFDEDFDDDFEDSFEADFEDEFDGLDIEAKFKRNIGKKISKISFQFDEKLWEELLFEFEDQSKLVLRSSRSSDENFIFVDEESFPHFIGAEILDIEIFEDYSGEDIFNLNLEYLLFKTNKGNLEIHFKNEGKLVDEMDYFRQYEEEYRKEKARQNSMDIIIYYWIFGFFD